MKEPTKKPKWEVWQPKPILKADAYAMQALVACKATEDQQRRVFEWLLAETRLRDETFVPGKPDVSDYLEGKRSIGLQINALINWKPPTGE